MERMQRAKQLFDYSHILTLENEWYTKQVEQYVLGALQFDASKDSTTELFSHTDTNTSAVLLAKEDGIFAGCSEGDYLAQKEFLRIQWNKKDGEKITKGEEIARIEGSFASLMRVERTLLNTLQRMSGIATATHTLVTTLGESPLICATRKTLWGALDKRAVAVGGGGTHRLGLWDGILIKDNHIDAAGGIDHLVKMLHETSPQESTQLREIEAASIEQAQEIMDAELPLNAIMCDNFSSAEIQKTLAVARENGFYDTYLFEASGGITEENIQEYAQTGVDVISLGSLTHSARALDISMNIA